MIKVEFCGLTYAWFCVPQLISAGPDNDVTIMLFTNYKYNSSLGHA